MIPANFKYERASSVDEAIKMLAQHGDDAKLVSGGHSLIPAMKLRLNMPDMLIDIGRIEELRYIKAENGHVCIGAGATHADIAKSDQFNNGLEFYPAAAKLIGDRQVRNKGTLGGSLAHADPAADWPAVILASGATIVTKGAEGTREISAADFFTGFYETALKENEILVEVRVPVPAANTTSSYAKFMQPASRFAIVGCATMMTKSGENCEDVKVAFTGVADTAFMDNNVADALKGKAINQENINAAAQTAAQGVDVMSDHFASVEYRTHLAKVYAKRALDSAVA